MLGTQRVTWHSSGVRLVDSMCLLWRLGVDSQSSCALGLAPLHYARALPAVCPALPSTACMQALAVPRSKHVPAWTQACQTASATHALRSPSTIVHAPCTWRRSNDADRKPGLAARPSTHAAKSPLRSDRARASSSAPEAPSVSKSSVALHVEAPSVSKPSVALHVQRAGHARVGHAEHHARLRDQDGHGVHGRAHEAADVREHLDDVRAQQRRLCRPEGRVRAAPQK